MKLAPAALAAALLAGAMTLPAAPAAAQNQRIVEIFGNDKCPTDQGSEIVVCRRLPEQERFRIPQTLRRTESEQRNVGTALAATTDSASRPSSGMENCTAVGAAGHTGCFRARAAAARAERKQIAEEVPVVDE